MKNKLKKIIAATLVTLMLVPTSGLTGIVAESNDEIPENGETAENENTETVTEENISEETEETEEETNETVVPEEENETPADEVELPAENENQPKENVKKTWESDGIKVEAEYDPDTFETDVELAVKVFEEGSSEYLDVAAALEEESVEYDSFWALDISFKTEDGEYLEPGSDVQVSIFLDTDVVEPAEEAESQLMHIKEDGTVATIENAEIDEDITEIVFSSDTFSPFVIAQIINNEKSELVEIDTDGWTAEGKFIIGYEEDEVTPIFASGFYEIDGETYYFDPQADNVVFKEGQKYIEGFWYLFDADGKMLKGFQEIADQDKTVYYDEAGHMIYGEKYIDGFWYYFHTVTGKMTKGNFQFISNQNKTCYYDDEGHMIYGQRYIDGHWYYFNTVTGKRVEAAFQKIADQNKTCYYNSKGWMLYGDQKINGKSYYFNTTTGAMYKGWRTVNGKKMFYYGDGKRASGHMMVYGNMYYFDPTNDDAIVTSGWVWVASHNKTCYFQADGTMAKGTVYINGIKHTFDKTTGKGQPKESWIKKHVKSRYYYLRVNNRLNTVTVYTRDYKGKFNIPVKAFLCSTGKSSTPTYKGIGFTSRWVNHWYYFPDHETYVQYPTYFEIPNPSYPNNRKKNGKYMFHSLIYETQNKYDMRTSSFYRLGTSASSGCVRLYARDAKWIYNNIQDGSTVEVYGDTKVAGPLGKPAKISSLVNGLRWDPTDSR